MASDTNADGTVYVPISKLQKYADSIRKGLQGGGGAMRKAVLQWAAIYRGFAKERFVKFSLGGGDWKPLKPSTIARRRKGKAKTVKIRRKGKTRKKAVAQGAVSILWDTGTLLGALDPQASIAPGALTEFIPFGVRVGYGGTAKHPATKGTMKQHTTKVTIAFIAAVHQHGSGNIPARPIIVPPDQKTTDMIVNVTERALSEEWKQAVG